MPSETAKAEHREIQCMLLTDRRSQRPNKQGLHPRQALKVSEGGGGVSEHWKGYSPESRGEKGREVSYLFRDSKTISGCCCYDMVCMPQVLLLQQHCSVLMPGYCCNSRAMVLLLLLGCGFVWGTPFWCSF